LQSEARDTLHSKFESVRVFEIQWKFTEFMIFFRGAVLNEIQ